MTDEVSIPTALGDVAARQLANATKTVPMMSSITPRWLARCLQWLPVEAGVFRLKVLAVVRIRAQTAAAAVPGRTPLPWAGSGRADCRNQSRLTAGRHGLLAIAQRALVDEWKAPKIIKAAQLVGMNAGAIERGTVKGRVVIGVLQVMSQRRKFQRLPLGPALPFQLLVPERRVIAPDGRRMVGHDGLR